MPYNIRPATKSDYRAIARLIENHWAVHTRIFMEDLQIRLEQYIGFVVEDAVTLRAFLLLEPLPAEISLIAVVAVHNQTDVLHLLQSTFPLIEFDFMQRGYRVIMQFGEAEWLTQPLVQLGFFVKEKMLTYEWHHKPLPDIPTHPHLRVRSAHPADLPDLLIIDHLAFVDMWHKSRLILRDALSRAALFTVALHDHKIVGYQWCDRVGNHAHLTRIAIHPHYQGQGIGTQLLYHAMQHLKARHIKHISLNTQEHNLRSQVLYQRFGFRQTKRVIEVLWKALDGD